ncbi:hypothetical protein BDP27DRAFT_1321234, partial [Rhodocollybia butyracea]
MHFNSIILLLGLVSTVFAIPFPNQAAEQPNLALRAKKYGPYPCHLGGPQAKDAKEAVEKFLDVIYGKSKLDYSVLEWTNKYSGSELDGVGAGFLLDLRKFSPEDAENWFPAELIQN